MVRWAIQASVVLRETQVPMADPESLVKWANQAPMVSPVSVSKVKRANLVRLSCPIFYSLDIDPAMDRKEIEIHKLAQSPRIWIC